jgi:hypothetical protein
MNILDENILKDQRILLQQWHIPIRQIGYDVGSSGMKDREIIPLLLHWRQPTFLTLDRDFYRRYLCHARYCIVFLNIEQDQTATWIRRFLRHPAFKTKAKRMGNVICLSSLGCSFWQVHGEKELHFTW